MISYHMQLKIKMALSPKIIIFKMKQSTPIWGKSMQVLFRLPDYFFKSPLQNAFNTCLVSLLHRPVLVQLMHSLQGCYLGIINFSLHLFLCLFSRIVCIPSCTAPCQKAKGQFELPCCMKITVFQSEVCHSTLKVRKIFHYECSVAD